MNLKIENLKRILSWFDIAESNLGDKDLILYDSIKEYLNDCGDSDADDLDTDAEPIDEEISLDYEDDTYDTDDYDKFSDD